MTGSLSIWSPVVVAQLKNPRRVKEQVVYTIDKIYRSMDDLKIKVKYTEIKIQGQVLEACIKLDILCLLEDVAGEMELVAREETVRDRIPLVDLDSSLDKGQQTDFIVNILDLYWEGEVRGYEICVTYFMDYMIIATREQVVKLVEREQEVREKSSLNEVLHQIEEEIAKVEEENWNLRRRIFFYERDISSLKKGIRKAENRNTALNKEINHYQKIVEELQNAIKEKEKRLQLYENFRHHSQYAGRLRGIPEKTEEKDLAFSLGKKIRQMFTNCF